MDYQGPDRRQSQQPHQGPDRRRLDWPFRGPPPPGETSMTPPRKDQDKKRQDRS
jgi:hypothetical protein